MTDRLSDRLYWRIRSEVEGGRLRPGATLQSTRQLAVDMGVSRKTVTTAYQRLAADGIVTARSGVASYVSEPTELAPIPTVPVTHPPRPQAIWGDIDDPVDQRIAAADFDFRVGCPDVGRFPYAQWRAVVADQLRQTVERASIDTGPDGHHRLRAAIARHISVSRAVRADPDSVLVTCGMQQAIDLIARVWLAPGDWVAVEDPGYPPPGRLLRSLGAGVVGVPVDAEGIEVARIPKDARLVYVTPSHQFPLGLTMSLARRRALLDWADRHGGLIIEDDYDSEFRYTGRPLEPLQSMEHSGRVIYVGSFSKTLLPSLRLGFLLAPPSLMPALRSAKYLTDRYTATSMQAALATFIEQGKLATHIDRMRRIYRQRHHRITARLTTEFADILDPVPSAAGLHLTAELRPTVAVRDTDLVAAARSVGIEISALSGLGTSGRSGLIFGYGLIELDRIDAGLRLLRGCLSGLGVT